MSTKRRERKSESARHLRRKKKERLLEEAFIWPSRVVVEKLSLAKFYQLRL